LKSLAGTIATISRETYMRHMYVSRIKYMLTYMLKKIYEAALFASYVNIIMSTYNT